MPGAVTDGAYASGLLSETGLPDLGAVHPV